MIDIKLFLDSLQNWYNYKVTCIHVFEFLKGKDFVKHVLRHIGTSAIPDLVFGLITCVEGADIKQNLLNVSVKYGCYNKK